jgi:hypothetical protein
LFEPPSEVTNILVGLLGVLPPQPILPFFSKTKEKKKKTENQKREKGTTKLNQN